MQQVLNPDNYRLYRRLIHIAGVDIDMIDGTVFQHPEALTPNGVYVCIQPPDYSRMFPNIENNRTEFEKPYVFQLPPDPSINGTERLSIPPTLPL